MTIRLRYMLAQAIDDGMLKLTFGVNPNSHEPFLKFFGIKDHVERSWWDMVPPPTECFPTLFKIVIGLVQELSYDDSHRLMGRICARCNRQRFDVTALMPDSHTVELSWPEVIARSCGPEELKITCERTGRHARANTLDLDDVPDRIAWLEPATEEVVRKLLASSLSYAMHEGMDKVTIGGDSDSGEAQVRCFGEPAPEGWEMMPIPTSGLSQLILKLLEDRESDSAGCLTGQIRAIHDEKLLDVRVRVDDDRTFEFTWSCPTDAPGTENAS